MTTEMAKSIESVAATQQLRCEKAVRKAERALLDAGAAYYPDSVDKELWDRFDEALRHFEAWADIRSTVQQWIS